MERPGVAMMQMLSITEWEDRFENSRTREMKRMQWVPVPNRFDGDGYTELMDHENAGLHFAAWVLIVEVASRCQVRGSLVRDNGKPHDPASLARLTRLNQVAFEEAIPRLVAIGWLTMGEGDCAAGEAMTGAMIHQENTGDGDIPHDAAGTLPGASDETGTPEGKGRELKGKEGKGTPSGAERRETAASPPAIETVLTFPVDGPGKTWALNSDRVAKYRERYPTLDVDSEMIRAMQWIEDNPRKRKTSQGMARFLTDWLNRSCEKASRTGGSGPKTFAEKKSENTRSAVEQFTQGGAT